MLYKTYGATQRVYRDLGSRRRYLDYTTEHLEKMENDLSGYMPCAWRGTDVEKKLAQIQAELDDRHEAS